MKNLFITLLIMVSGAACTPESASEIPPQTCGELSQKDCFKLAFDLYESGTPEDRKIARELFTDLCKNGRRDACDYKNGNDQTLKVISIK